MTIVRLYGVIRCIGQMDDDSTVMCRHGIIEFSCLDILIDRGRENIIYPDGIIYFIRKGIRNLSGREYLLYPDGNT